MFQFVAPFRVGLYVPQPLFSHGQLYVALSRVRRASDLKILVLDENKKQTTKCNNVVVQEILSM